MRRSGMTLTLLATTRCRAPSSLTADRPRQPVMGSGPTGSRRAAVPILGALIGVSWGVLWLWGQSPYGRYLEHGRWTAAGPAAALCRALPAGQMVLPLALY